MCFPANATFIGHIVSLVFCKLLGMWRYTCEFIVIKTNMGKNMIESHVGTVITGKHLPEEFDLEMLNTQLKMLCDFCESSGLDFDKICNDYINKENSDKWKLVEAINETESEKLINEYYSTNTQYLIELTLHECNWNYQKMFWSIAEFAKKRNIKNVLDFGGGAGGLSIYLGKKGINCDYADVVGQTWNYATYRFKKEGLAVAQLTEDSLSEMSANYDLIVSVDCLEHLKNLPKYIALFNSLLRDNGFLLTRFVFFGDGLHLSSNHKYNCLNVFNKMCEDNGFVFMGQYVTRLRTNFLVPNLILRLLKTRPSSGRKLIYKKEVI